MYSTVLSGPLANGHLLPAALFSETTRSTAHPWPFGYDELEVRPGCSSRGMCTKRGLVQNRHSFLYPKGVPNGIVRLTASRGTPWSRWRVR